jgi:hypothetical protein
MRDGMDDGVQIEIYGKFVGEVPGDDGKDGPVMETVQTEEPVATQQSVPWTLHPAFLCGW